MAGITVLPATYAFIHDWTEPYLPLLPSQYSLLISRLVEDRRLGVATSRMTETG